MPGEQSQPGQGSFILLDEPRGRVLGDHPMRVSRSQLDGREVIAFLGTDAALRQHNLDYQHQL